MLTVISDVTVSESLFQTAGAVRQKGISGEVKSCWTALIGFEAICQRLVCDERKILFLNITALVLVVAASY